MTISATASSTTAQGNGVVNQFDFDFPCPSVSDLQVIYTDATGTPFTLSPTQYSVTLNAVLPNQLWPLGGTVVYPLVGLPISIGTSITIARIVPLTQETSLDNQGNFYPAAVERALDTLTMELQQVNGRTGQIRGVWQTGVRYNFGDIVQDGINGGNTGSFYTCAQANLSGVWATDLANGDWSLSLPATIPVASLPLAIGNGGTGAITGAAALANLGGISLAGNNNYTGANNFTAGSALVTTQAIGDSSTKAASTAFVQQAAGIVFNVKTYGALGNASHDDTTAIQSAITAATSAGGIVFFPAGEYLVSATLNVTAPLIFMGVGSGAGPGTVSNANCSQILASSAFLDGDIFNCVTNFGVTFRDLQFNVQGASLRSAGAAIHLTGTNPTLNYHSLVENCAFNGQYVCIQESLCGDVTVRRNYFQNWAHIAVLTEDINGAIETSGGQIDGNQFTGDTTPSTTVAACIQSHNGYLKITNNGLSGCQYGIRITLDTFNAASIMIKNNSIEEQTVQGIRVENGGSITGANIEIIGNQFSNLTNVSAFQGHIVIADGSTSWISKLTIKDNTTQSAITNASAGHIILSAGQNVVIQGNALDNMGASASVPAIGAGGTHVAKPFYVGANTLSGFTATYNLGTNVGNILLDDSTNPFAFSSLPAVTNGSQIYCSDGQPTSSSNGTITSGGGGCPAFRDAGTWKTFAV